MASQSADTKGDRDQKRSLCVPLSHPFVERLIGTIRREYSGHTSTTAARTPQGRTPDASAPQPVADLRYCVLALMMLNLLRRQLTQAGIALSIVDMMNQLTAIHEVTLLYPCPRVGQEPFARSVLSQTKAKQNQMLAALGLERYRSS